MKELNQEEKRAQDAKNLLAFLEVVKNDFKKDLESYDGTKKSLCEITGLTPEQITRFLKNKNGQPKSGTMLSAYIKFLESKNERE